MERTVARPKKDANLTRITVSVDPEDYEKMETLARNSGLSTAFLIRRSMREFIARYGEGGCVLLELRGGK
jgi:hypothetical protein